MRDIEIIVQLGRAGERLGEDDDPLEIIERLLYFHEDAI